MPVYLCICFSVKLPTDDWLCHKLEKLNPTIVKGHPSRSSEARGLSKDQFIKMQRSQSEWYNNHYDKQGTSSSKVSYWYNELAKLNSAYSRIAKPSGFIVTQLASLANLPGHTEKMGEISQRMFSFIYNQAASFSHCLTRVGGKRGFSVESD